MKKMAIYVEGETELRFIDRLLREIADEKNLQIVLERAFGGGGELSVRIMLSLIVVVGQKRISTSE